MLMNRCDGDTSVVCISMRHWNTMNTYDILLLSIEATYEELKHQAICKGLDKVFSFQTTYEELKPVPTVFICGVFQGFQTTYEELKLQSWNIDFHTKFFKLPDYL